MGTLQDSGVFNGCQITIDFAVSSLPFKRKQEIRREVIENGGIISYILTRQTSFLVTGNPERTLSSYKGRSAVKSGIPVVSFDFITECVKAERLLDPHSYLLSETPESQNFSSGKIVAKTQTKKWQKKVVKKFKPFDLSKIRVWPYKEAISGPVFDEEKYEIVKNVVLQGLDSAGGINTFYALELHVIPTFELYTGWKCRVFSHHGNLKEIREGSLGCKECMYFSTVEEALEAYIALYEQQTQSPFSMSKNESFLSHRIGSEKMMQLTMADQCSEEDSVISPEVVNLVDVIWNEATGRLSDILAVPEDSIKLEDVEKAEAILLVMKKALDANEGEAAIKNLSDEFYAVIRHKNSGQQIQSKHLIAQKQDLCQLIRDMVSLGEATNWSRRGAHAKYRALKTHIECLAHHSKEFDEIKAYITSSETSPEEIQVLNVYSVHRPVEERSFSCDIGNKKLLFHASKVSSFVGILSRGLLLPKIIVDDFGGKRSDAGMLGGGIYFASSASTSAKYSTPSSSKGTRLMLINEVALGKVKHFRNFSMDLVSPPVGYDSCHGVRGTDNEPSDFKDDEYVVYKGDQQKIRYLVEFVLPGDVLLPRDDISLDSGFSDGDLEVTGEDSSVDLSDVMSVVDPLAKVEAGLKGTGDKPIPLSAVHIKARLLDLAAQVIVFQAYKNTSSVPIEAKYVFPLDDMAAVCGFEAFINGKHIVGEVKEKEQAHKEYREAISQGHGAYLMDEETPDIFTVNVGNLPPGAQVLIKITYVAELMVDKEHICFTLPGSVAPWKRSKALEEVLQGDVDTIQVEDEQPSDFSAQISVEMPFDIRTIHSPSHPINIKRTATKAVVELEPGYPLGDGFQLLIGLAEIHVPRMWVERHVTKPDSQACMLTFYPEFEAESPQEVEVVFLLDLSCSMKGSSLQDAKKILLMCLSHMKEDWIFNIIVFGSKHAELFPCSKQKDKQAYEQAVEYITPLNATKGSTELWRVLHKLYLLPNQSSADHPRNVFLISDGHVTEEETTLQLIRKHCQSNRLFTFGVGSTANRYLLRAMSKLGAGAAEFFNSKAKSKWKRKVKGQLSNAEQPGLTSVAVTWQQHDSSANPPVQAPHQLLSLFNGSRQVVYGFADNCTQATLTAEINGKTVSTMVSTADLNISTGKILHQLTARAVIRDWEEGSLHDQRTGHEVVKRSRKDFIISLSKEFSLVSKFTSFVAVERREKDEVFVEGLGPSIEQLVALEDVDILQYMGWEERPGIELESCKMSTEERLEKLLKEATVLETCAVLQAEGQYRDILKEASEKLGCEHPLTDTVKSLLFKLNTSLVGGEDKLDEFSEDDYDDVEGWSESLSSSSECSMDYCLDEERMEPTVLDHDEFYRTMQKNEQMEETYSVDELMSMEEDECDSVVVDDGERVTFGEKEEEEERELGLLKKVFREEPVYLCRAASPDVPRTDRAVAAVRIQEQSYKLQAAAPTLEQAQFPPHERKAGHPPSAESSISLGPGYRLSRRPDVPLEGGISHQQGRSSAVLTCDEIETSRDKVLEASETQQPIQAPQQPPPPPPPPPPAPVLAQTETKPLKSLALGRRTEEDNLLLSMRKSLSAMLEREKTEEYLIPDYDRVTKDKREETSTRREQRPQPFPRTLMMPGMRAPHVPQAPRAESELMFDTHPRAKGLQARAQSELQMMATPPPRAGGFSFGSSLEGRSLFGLVPPSEAISRDQFNKAKTATSLLLGKGSQPQTASLFDSAVSQAHFPLRVSPVAKPLTDAVPLAMSETQLASTLTAVPTPLRKAVQNQASSLEMPMFGLGYKDPIPVPTAPPASGLHLKSCHEVPSDGRQLPLQQFSSEPAEEEVVIRAPRPKKRFLREKRRSTGVSFGELTKEKDETVQSVTECIKKMEQIFAKQNPEGYWKIADLAMVGIDTLKVVQMLIDAGAKSLGARKFEDIQRILATLMMLAFVKIRLLLEITISPPLGKAFQTNISGAGEQYAVNVTRALHWIKNQERKIPFLFSRLELGVNWNDAAEKVLEGVGA